MSNAIQMQPVTKSKKLGNSYRGEMVTPSNDCTGLTVFKNERGFFQLAQIKPFAGTVVAVSALSFTASDFQLVETIRISSSQLDRRFTFKDADLISQLEETRKTYIANL